VDQAAAAEGPVLIEHQARDECDGPAGSCTGSQRTSHFTELAM